MKKRNLLKRIAAIAMSAAMVLGMASAVSAAEPSSNYLPTIDANQKGSLTIVKMKTGSSDAAPEYIQNVTFKYAQIGGFDISKENVNGFTIENPTLESLLKRNGLKPIGMSTPNIYDGKAIQDALKNAINSESLEDIKNFATSTMPQTNAQGATTVRDLNLGIYLVVETDAPAQVTKKADPFIVSIPILDTNEDGTQGWNYNVVAKPKNDYIGVPSPEKKITDEDGNPLNDPSSMINQDVYFEISSTLPEIAGELEKFNFVDTVSAGLTLYNQPDYGIEKVQVGKTEGDTIQWDTSTTIQHTESLSGSQLTITFNPSEIKEFVESEYTNIRVVYRAKLNENAIVSIGNVEQNINKFGVDYKNDLHIDTDEITVKVPTYGFTLQKKGVDGDANALAEATFELYDAKKDGNKVAFYTGVDADGKVNAPTDSTGKVVSTTQVTTDDQGQASFYGLKAGTYYLQEVKAPDGYNLLKERVKIEVTENTTANGVDITVVNTKGFTLPATGGMGTTIFTIGGIVLMAGAAVLIVRMNRKEKEK